MKMPTLFISHGGGPWPYIPEMKGAYARTSRWLGDFSRTLPEKPQAILMVSGHWVERDFTVSSAAHPPMIYDYGGFPDYTYQVKYPAPGSPLVAKRTGELLGGAGIACRVNSDRGFDHGTFVPLSLMFPDADVPVVSMSIQSNYDPAGHILMGQALAPLRDEGILILGSGLSYHNMRGFGSEGGASASAQFGKWLGETIAEPDSAARNRKLKEWEKAPAAREAHPHEDHLIPLMVVAGAALNDSGEVAFLDHVMNVEMASYRFG